MKKVALLNSIFAPCFIFCSATAIAGEWRMSTQTNAGGEKSHQTVYFESHLRNQARITLICNESPKEARYIVTFLEDKDVFDGGKYRGLSQADFQSSFQALSFQHQDKLQHYSLATVLGKDTWPIEMGVPIVQPDLRKQEALIATLVDYIGQPSSMRYQILNEKGDVIARLRHGNRGGVEAAKFWEDNCHAPNLS